MNHLIQSKLMSVLAPLIIMLILSSSPRCEAGQAKAVRQSPHDLTVAIDPRIELTSIIFRLAGHPEYNQGRVASYIADIEEQFGPHRDHPVIKLAQKLKRDRGVSYDACMSFAIHITDATGFEERVPFDAPNLALDRRWEVASARKFLAEMKDFAKTTDFAGFVTDHQALYETTESRMRAMLAESADLDWFERFFGVAPTAPFTVAIGLVNGGSSYGPKFIAPDGSEHLYAIIGAWVTDDEGLPVFNQGFLGTVVHEFSHSFANPLIDAHLDELQDAGEAIYPAVAAEMRRQAYGDWRTMFRESLVRASTVRYILDHDGEEAARREIARQENERSFLWTGDLVKILDEYDANRDEYPRLESFMPRVIEFFDEYAPTLAERVAARERELEAKRPHVKSMTPPNGAVEVAHDLDEIVIRFDRPMAAGYSVMLDPEGGRETFPELIESGWNEDRTEYTMKVKLKPDFTYRFALNWEGGGAFQSAAGVPLDRYPIEFTTSDMP